MGKGFVQRPAPDPKGPQVCGGLWSEADPLWKQISAPRRGPLFFKLEKKRLNEAWLSSLGGDRSSFFSSLPPPCALVSRSSRIEEIERGAPRCLCAHDVFVFVSSSCFCTPSSFPLDAQFSPCRTCLLEREDKLTLFS